MKAKEIFTYYAPAERLPVEVVKEQNNLVKEFLTADSFIDDINQMVIILNKERQIIFANKLFVEFTKQNNLLGQRLGEVLNCEHSFEEKGGCGTSLACSTCAAVNAILYSQKKGEDRQECRIIAKNNIVYDFDVWTKSITIKNLALTIVAIRDISNKKRRNVLERIFFHDILNTAGNLKGFLELMQDATCEEMKEYSQLSLEVTETLIEELKAQRTLRLAEDSKLEPDVVDFNVISLMNDVVSIYKKHQIGEGKELILINHDTQIIINSDKTLLKRVLINLTKNALEASVAGNKVTLQVKEKEDKVIFSVHNETYIPMKIQLQIFQRSFSTKGVGRGIGTYSVKLLTEKYLKGKVSFVSTEEEGTTFYVELPKKI
jgi:signal transduction histidine kinase